MLGDTKIKCYKPVNHEYIDAYNRGIDDYTSTILPRLTDAISIKDIESMTNLINEIAEQLKAGGNDE